MPILRLCTAACALILVSITTAATAAPTAKDKADAKALAADGRKALKDKRWTDAISALKKADRLDSSLGLAMDLAQAQIGAGKLVEASKTLAAASAGADATPAAKRGREAAKKALGDLQARIPTVKVKVTGAPADKTSVLIDGIEVDGSAEIPVNPGEHSVGATADGFVSADKDVRCGEGAREQVSLKLVRNRPAAAVAVEKEKRTGSRVPGAVVTTIGAAGLAVGGIFGGLAWTKSNDVKSTCNGNLCPQVEAGDISASKTYGNVSTVAFIAGGVVAATGIVLLIAAPGGGAKSDDAGKSARVAPWIGPGGAGLGAAGSF
jgi:hypothetical protein